MASSYAPMQLAFPPDVYRANLALVQADLRAGDLAAVTLFDPENIYWLTGYRSIGYFTFQCVVVLPEGAPIMVSRQVNHAVALANANIGTFVAIQDTDDPVDILAGFFRERVASAGPIGLETASTYLSVQSYRKLEAALPGRLVDWGGVIEKARTIKSPDQLAFMRQAAKAAVAGLDAAVKAVRPGCTENDLAAAMLHGATKAGSEYTRVPLVVTGQATGVCFTTWERREVKRGDVVFLEAAANINRYHAMIARNCIVGPATAEHKFHAQVVIDALNRAIDAIRPGVTSGAVDAACRAVFEKAGLGHYFDHRTAYGIGIGFPPNWAEGRFLALKPDDPTPLQPGMTFHLVPSIFMPQFCFMTSESVVVTEDGCEVLTDYPRKLIELDV
ncbi:Xaa-Pro peptidase family protein [Bosea sp. (in: a-proteobacteria)]|uniref:M24 family metallopeptidase n=1 Tax=Bosea sp. (in: a-proteobacteria) TaxID=1871050 RepID=UPI002602779A|nr:Xaa-Pro peptidase family protein [Bosea sp. (in: a-proteobacteria)]MCO5089954.1 Xaa-Pro peptidase family protein [Bosea sp. (in: a-proteobacteria)]